MQSLKIAFVASGGAARGLAHLGVLRACEELGVVPEIFVGASSGALVAATYGQDIPLDVLLDAYRLPWRRRHKGPRLTLSTFLGAPRVSDLSEPGYLFSGAFSLDRLERYVAETLPVNDFRELPNPVFITAVDIDSGQRVVFGPGYVDDVPVSQALAASCCIPGVFRPFRIDGRYFVSGEIARTLSADLAVAAGANVIIASNIYRPEERKGDAQSIARLGAHRVLRQSMSVLLNEKEKRGVELLTKLYPNVAFIDVAPEVGEIGFANQFASRSLVLRGYRAGLRVLASAKERGAFGGVGTARTLN